MLREKNERLRINIDKAIRKDASTALRRGSHNPIHG